MSIETLKWYEDMGVDEAIAEVSENHLKEKPKMQPVATPKEQLASPEYSKLSVTKLAENCSNLEELKKLVLEYKGLSICKTATNTVFCDGVAKSDIMLIGEAPGAEEDLQGIPFCGPSGKMLDQMFSYIGISRKENCYITNTIFWRPPGNRKPTPEELAVCSPFVEKHISFIKPKLIILVGGTAVSALMDSKVGITKIRGKFLEYKNKYLEEPVKTMAIFHPSYLLRSPGQKRLAWQDLLTIKQYLDEHKN